MSGTTASAMSTVVISARKRLTSRFSPRACTRNGMAACCVVDPSALATSEATESARRNASVPALAPNTVAIAMGMKNPGALPAIDATVARDDALQNAPLLAAAGSAARWSSIRAVASAIDRGQVYLNRLGRPRARRRLGFRAHAPARGGRKTGEPRYDLVA